MKDYCQHTPFTMRIPRIPTAKIDMLPNAKGFLRTQSEKAYFPKQSHSKFHSRQTHARPCNQVLSPITTPPILHDYLRLASSNNILLLLLFTTSSCAPCRIISPLLEILITSRTPQPVDRFSSLALADVELDSPDHSNGIMADLGVEYGISSIPSLVGLGGRRAERVTEKLVDTKMMGDRESMKAWLDEWMEKGDPSGPNADNMSGVTGGILGKLFGGK